MNRRYFIYALLSLAPTLTLTAGAMAESKLKVCATVPELGSIARHVGGDAVDVTVFAKGTEDPHFVEARPSFIREMAAADLYLKVGAGMEVGWAPVLEHQCRNARVQPGGVGYVDCSKCVPIMEIPTGRVDRSLGDVHPEGNPHYLLDPVNGIKVARCVCDKLIELRPGHAEAFRANYARFRAAIGERLVGDKLATKYDVEKLMKLVDYGKLSVFLEQQGELDQLGGWMGEMLRHRGVKAVDDHNSYVYLAHRYGIDIVEHLEPKPGIPPTTRHLGHVISLIKSQHVPIVITTAYYDQRHADFVASKTGATIVRLAHQAGARPDTDDYIEMSAYNAQQLAQALAGR